MNQLNTSFFLATALALLAPLSHASARDDSYTTPANESLEWGEWYYLNSVSRCEPGKLPRIIIMQQPKYGELHVVSVRAVPRNHKGCKKPVPAVSIRYTPHSVTDALEDDFEFIVRHPAPVPGDWHRNVTIKIVAPKR